MDSNSSIQAIVVIEGKLKNESPFVIGKGEGDMIDLEIVKDEKGNPYIPATSFVGALKHHIEDVYQHESSAWDYFWGSKSDKRGSTQSHFIVSDLRLSQGNALVSIRDGIAIDPKKGITKHQDKYDYEVVNNECIFNFKAEVKIRKKQSKEDILPIIKTCLFELERGNVYIGAMTTKGFGRFKLTGAKVYLFCFPDDGKDYLVGLERGFSDNKLCNTEEWGLLRRRHSNNLIIDANFEIKNSLIIGSYSSDPKDPDKVNIRFNGKPVISGTSFKGAIRARAVKILNTLIGSSDRGEELIRETFGWVETEEDEKRKKSKKYKSKVIVEESILENVCEKVQTRIKIDRFTGGVVEGALLEVKPVWHKSEKVNLKIRVKDCKPWEVGLMLLILKDLWTSDLPIGGEKAIGRGVLVGKDAIIHLNGRKISITSNGTGLSIDGASHQYLERYVGELLNYVGGGAR